MIDVMIYLGFVAGGMIIGYLIRVLQNETREFIAMQERDDKWDDEHGVHR